MNKPESADKKSIFKRYELMGYVYILPAALIIFIFHILPILYTAILSLYKYEVPSPPEFIGLKNYSRIINDATFWLSLKNTVFYAVFTIPTTIVISLFIALLLNTKIKGVSWYRIIYFLPVITSINAVALVWKWIYHPKDFGLLNYLLSFLGISTKEFLLDPDLAMPAIIVMSIWKGLGYNVIIFLAGLQNVPSSLYDAAKIDGAGIWARFRHITWPLISPTTFFILIMSTISSFQVFAQVYMMTPNGGPLQSTTVVVFYLYEKAFKHFEMGYASALAMVLFGIIFCMTILQRKYFGKKVHYQ